MELWACEMIYKNTGKEEVHFFTSKLEAERTRDWINGGKDVDFRNARVYQQVVWKTFEEFRDA